MVPALLSSLLVQGCEGAEFSGALVCVWLWEYLMTSQVLQELRSSILVRKGRRRLEVGGAFPQPSRVGSIPGAPRSFQQWPRVNEE